MKHGNVEGVSVRQSTGLEGLEDANLPDSRRHATLGLARAFSHAER